MDVHFAQQPIAQRKALAQVEGHVRVRGLGDLDAADHGRPPAEGHDAEVPLGGELEDPAHVLVRLREQDEVRGDGDRSEAEPEEVAVRLPRGVREPIEVRARDALLAHDLPEVAQVRVREAGGGERDRGGVRDPQELGVRELEDLLQERQESGPRLERDRPVVEPPAPPLRGTGRHRARDSLPRD